MIPFDNFEDVEAEYAFLRRLKRWHQAYLAAHPDCRDPDHPGCHLCEEPESDDDE